MARRRLTTALLVAVALAAAAAVHGCELTANPWSGPFTLDAPANATGTEEWRFEASGEFVRRITALNYACATTNALQLTVRGNYAANATTGTLFYSVTSTEIAPACPGWQFGNGSTPFAFVEPCAALCFSTNTTLCDANKLAAVIFTKCSPDPLAETSSNEIILGVIIAICGNVLISVALNVQKFSHNKNSAATEKKSYLLRPTWWAGMLLMGLGEIGNFLAYAFAPASVVAPIGTVALVCNAIIAPVVLKERFRVQDLIGIIVAIGGAVVVVVFASSDHSSGGLSEAAIRAAFTTTQSIVYMCISFVLMVVLLILSKKMKGKYLAVEMSMVALFGGYTVVATKAVSELLTTDFLLMFTYWIFYVMLVVMIVTIVLQIRALQEALQHFDSTEVIPANFVCFTIGTITTSGVIYGDFQCMAALDIVFFCLGCCLTFFGVYCITAGRKALKKSATVLGNVGDDSGDTINGDPNPDESAPLILATGNDESKDAKATATTTDHAGDDETLAHKLREVTDATLDTIMTGIRFRRDVQALPLEQVVVNYKTEHDNALPVTAQGIASPGNEVISMNGDVIEGTPASMERGQSGTPVDDGVRPMARLDSDDEM